MSKRSLHVKIRVQLTERMSVGEARAKLRRTIRTGIVQKGIRVAWVDWHRPDSAGVANEGQYLGPRAAEALRDFYGAIHHDETRTRVEVVHDG